MCPRLGDAFALQTHVDGIKAEVAQYRIRKAAEKHLDTLDLAGCNFSFLPEDLAASKEVRERIVDLNLARNQLFNSDSVFLVLQRLENLRRLAIPNNHLNGSLSELAGSLVHLEELDLDGNQLTRLPDSCENWTKLRVFSAGNNSLLTLPPGVERWTKLEQCNLRNNKLKELPSNIGTWELLKRLFVGGNELTALPSCVAAFTLLVELDARQNAITELPQYLASCQNLEHLNLGDNKIEDVPMQLLKNLTKMRELYLYRNKLETLPDEMSCLVALEKLSVSKNNLRTLPETVGDLEHLKELYLNGNAKFTALPGSVGKLGLLRELAARNCPKLKSLPREIETCDSLVELDIRSGGKKDVCKVPQEVTDKLATQKCTVRGAVIKKAKGKKGKK